MTAEKLLLCDGRVHDGGAAVAEELVRSLNRAWDEGQYHGYRCVLVVEVIRRWESDAQGRLVEAGQRPTPLAPPADHAATP